MKKHIKRISCLVMALVLTASLGVTAFAASNAITLSAASGAEVNDTTSAITAYMGESAATVALRAAVTTDYTDTLSRLYWSVADTAVASFPGTTVGNYNTTISAGATSAQLTLNSIGNTTLTVGNAAYFGTILTGTKTGRVYTLKVLQDTVTTVKISGPTTRTLAFGDSANLTASVTYTHGTTGSAVTWASSNEAVATVDANGTVKAVGLGTANITAVSKANGVTTSVPVAFTVNPKVTVSPTTLDMGVGGTGSLTATAQPAGTYTYTWTSSNTGAATVAQSGNPAAVTGVALGTSTITVTATSGVSTATATATVNVKPIATAIDIYQNTTKVTNTTVSMTRSPMQLKCVTTPADALGTMTWTSSDNSVLTVDSTGLVTTANNKNSTAVITCTLNDGTNTLSVSCTVQYTAYNPDVTVNLDGDQPYTFSAATAKNSQSAAAMIDTAVANVSGKNYNYILFGPENSYVGTLYTRELAGVAVSGTKIYRNTAGQLNTGDLYFVPSTPGTYSRTFAAYDALDNKIADCTLRLVVPDTINGAADVTYSVPVSSKLMMDEAGFTAFFKNATSQSNYLSSVEFTGVTYSNKAYPGYFLNNAQQFAPGNGVRYYTASYTGTANSGNNYLNRVSYNSPAVQCYLVVDFTCYGGANKNYESVTAKGQMYITVTGNAVRDISYSVSAGTPINLDAGDFVTEYMNALSVNSAGSFYIRFTGVPAMGSLYVGGSRQLTAANCQNYMLRVNYNGTGYSLSDTVYQPGNYSTGTDKAGYAAYDTTGKLLYTGDVDFIYGKSTVGTGVCYSEGREFYAADFPQSQSNYTVTFFQPAVGKLYLNYTPGSSAAVTGTMKFYIKDSAYGSYPVSDVTYMPPNGYSGKVSVAYTAVSPTGQTVTGTIELTAAQKTSSAYFDDVTAANTGAWSAPAVDYAGKWGLIKGTGGTSFSPQTTMTRGMVCTVLYRAAGSPAVKGTCPFTDVKYSDYFYTAVTWAYEKGIAGGVSSSSFAPNAPVTREQIAVLLRNFAGSLGMSTAASGTLVGYSDYGSVSPWARDAMSWAVGHGIISGTGANTLSPAGRASRAQVAVMLYRLLVD